MMKHSRSDLCYLCGGRATDRHHIYNGAMRSKSEQYGAVIKVCRDCHEEIHHKHELREELKKEFQHRIMQNYNLTIDEFRAIFKKNYV